MPLAETSHLMEPVNVSSQTFRSAFVLILVLGVSLLFLAVAWPFLKALLLGAIFAGLCHSFYQWLTRRLRGRKALAAALTVLLLIILGFV
jgi:predicted PurR-regulated permease PerM